MIQPDPHMGRDTMSITGIVHYGDYGPCVQLRRTISSTLGSNTIAFVDEFTNRGNQAVPHAWLLHINFGYPLVDAGAELCYDSARIEPTERRNRWLASSPASITSGFQALRKISAGRTLPSGICSLNQRIVPAIRPWRSSTASSRWAWPSITTPKNSRDANWQHFGPGEYVDGTGTDERER